MALDGQMVGWMGGWMDDWVVEPGKGLLIAIKNSNSSKNSKKEIEV